MNALTVAVCYSSPSHNCFCTGSPLTHLSLLHSFLPYSLHPSLPPPPFFSTLSFLTLSTFPSLLPLSSPLFPSLLSPPFPPSSPFLLHSFLPYSLHLSLPSSLPSSLSLLLLPPPPSPLSLYLSTSHAGGPGATGGGGS